MNSVCESHYHPGGRDRGAVEGNCVAAMRGGEQPETEDWSQIQVNSIRHLNRVSPLAKGEACRINGESVTVQGLPILETDRLRCGWSGNDQKSAWPKWRERPERRSEGLVAVRAFVVAMKPGNSGGAKGRRKMKTPEAARNSTSSIAARLERGRCMQFPSRTDVWRPSWERDACASKDTLNQSFVRPWFCMRSTSPLWGNSSTGEPDAGNPPVRFGGRGRFHPGSYPYQTEPTRSSPWRRLGAAPSKQVVRLRGGRTAVAAMLAAIKPGQPSALVRILEFRPLSS